MKKQRMYQLALIVVLLTALFLRVYPASQTTELMKFDSYYHARTANLIKDNGLVSYEPWPDGGRPHLYPPGYHFLLIFVNLLGFGMMSAVKFTLPIIFTIGIGVSYFVIKNHSNEKKALLTSFLLAINPVLITESFGSPQVIGFLIFVFALHFFLEKKWVYSGVLMGVSFWFSPMASVFFSFVLLIYSLFKNYKETYKFILPALLIAGIWLLLRFDLLYSYNGVAFSYFAKKIDFSSFLNPWYLLLPLLVLPFVKIPKKEVHKIALILTVTSLLFYLSFYYTKVFHPWRQAFYLMIGLSFLAPEILVKKKRLLLVFSAVLLFLLSIMSFPGLVNSDFQAINQFNENDLVLASHDTCAVILTKTNSDCMLDISFESIEDQNKFIELEEFFWKSKPDQLQETIDNYDFNKIMINSNGWSDSLLNELNINKKYIAFECWGPFCTKPTSIYEK